MAASLSVSPLTSTFSTRKIHLKISLNHVISSIIPSAEPLFKSNARRLTFQASHHFGPLLATRASSDGFPESVVENETLPSFEERPGKFLLWVIFWASASLVWFAASGEANAALASIRASSSGLKIASALRRLGWPDEAVVFALATLPVLELRGAIPVGYWMQLNPVPLTVLSVLGLVFSPLFSKPISEILCGCCWNSHFDPISLIILVLSVPLNLFD